VIWRNQIGTTQLDGSDPLPALSASVPLAPPMQVNFTVDQMRCVHQPEVGRAAALHGDLEHRGAISVPNSLRAFSTLRHGLRGNSNASENCWLKLQAVVILCNEMRQG